MRYMDVVLLRLEKIVGQFIPSNLGRIRGSLSIFSERKIYNKTIYFGWILFFSNALFIIFSWNE